jgi:hypothetical protein
MPLGTGVSGCGRGPQSERIGWVSFFIDLDLTAFARLGLREAFALARFFVGINISFFLTTNAYP